MSCVPWIATTLVTPDSDGPDDERQIEEAVRAGRFAQSNWLPKSMTNVTSSYINSAKWVIWYWWLLLIVFPSLLIFWLLILGSFHTFSLNLEKVMPMMIRGGYQPWIICTINSLCHLWWLKCTVGVKDFGLQKGVPSFPKHLIWLRVFPPPRGF